MDKNMKTTMRGRFRLFPLATEYGARVAFEPTQKEYKLTPEPPDTEFRKEFPPDPTIGSELEDAARVWKVYRKEAKAFDDGVLDGWSTTLDILLIFAGLFSAVATAFVIESYQSLQPDNAAYAAKALYMLVAASNHPSEMILPPPPDLAYKSSLSRWINGLWFTSILLSLAVAFLSILAKQWITEYRARNNASAKSPKDWVLRREVYFQALNSWHVAEVVAFLPFLLHLSLFLFLAGVVAFLWTLDKAIGIWIIVLGGSLGVFYIACTLIPLWVPQCPTSTPLSTQMRTSALAFILTGLTVILSALRTLQETRSFVIIRFRALSSTRSCRLVWSYVTAFRDTCKRVLSLLSGPAITMVARHLRGLQRARTSNHLESFNGAPFTQVLNRSAAGEGPNVSERLKTAAERLTGIRNDKSGIFDHLARNRDVLQAAALHWLIVEVSDSDAVAVGLQALGAFRWNSPAAEFLRGHDQLVNFPDETGYTRSTSAHTSSEVLRVIRSVLCMCRHGERVDICQRVPSSTQTNDADYPDLALLRADSIDHSIAPNIDTWREASPSLASTALHAMRASDSHFGLGYLLCCDVDPFTDAEWGLALSASDLEHCVDINLIPQYFYPFYLAVLIHASYRNETRSLFGPLLQVLRILVRVHTQREGIPDIYHLLSPSASNILSSRHFRYDSSRNHITAILLYLSYDLKRAMATANSIVPFWTAFACVASRWQTGLTHTEHLTPVSMCRTALRTWRGSERIRNAVLDAILLPPPVTSTSSPSFWTVIAGWSISYGIKSFLLYFMDAVAVGLCFSVRDGQNPAQTVDWIDRFFQDFPYRSLAYASYRELAPLPPLGDSKLSHHLVHLMQHCEELRPQWLAGYRRLGGDKIDLRHLAGLMRMREVAARRGRCQSCPKHLGYPPLP